MEAMAQLTYFYHAVSADQRISSTHISLYMALFRLWMENRFCNPVTVNRELLMQWAKISARTTYNKCMGELHRYGYIQYVPSFNYCLGSLVFLKYEAEDEIELNN